MRSVRKVVTLAGSAALVLSLSGLAPAAVAADGGSSTAGAAAQVVVEVEEWSATTGYDHGDQARFAGALWEALWWTQGQEPGHPNGPWQELRTTADGQVVWTPSRAFNAGDVAVHEGRLYVAHWYTRNQDPTDPNGPWRRKGQAADPATPTDWESDVEYDTGALVRHDGRLWQALWWTGRHQPGALDGPWGEVAFTPGGDVIWTPTRPFTTGDEVVWQGLHYEATWWTRNQAPGDPNGPWRPVDADAEPTVPKAWAAGVVYAAGDVALHLDGRYVATQANRDAEPGAPTSPWTAVPDAVGTTAPPTIAGKVRVGATVRARTGRWDDSAATFSYRWFAGKRPLSHGGGRTFTVPRSARGSLLRVVVTAHRHGDAVGSAASKAVRVKPRGGSR